MWRRVERAERDEAGFSLVEVILAMVIIVGVLALMLGIVVSSLTTVAQARQRQTATALATQGIEVLRALPYDMVTLNHAGDTPDATATYAVFESGVYRLRTTLPSLNLNEQLMVNDVSGRTKDITVDEVTYRVHTYVTLAANDAFNLTVLVTYTSAVSHGQRITAQRSVTFSPAGCLSTAQNPFAAPCQAYFTATAGQTLGGITVTNPNDGTAPILGFDNAGGTTLELGLGSNVATLFVEQTASANSNAMTSGAAQDSATPGSSGGVTSIVDVDSDPSSEQGQALITTTTGQTSAAQSLTGIAGALTVKPGTGDHGRSEAAIYAAGTHCIGIGPSGPGLNTGPDPLHLRPCASSEVTAPTSAATLNYLPNSPGGFSSMTLPILSVAGTSTPARAVAAQLAVANLDACDGGGPMGVGCAYAAATRTLGEVRVGYPLTGGVGPVGMDNGLVRLSGLSEQVRAEEGQGAGVPTYTRTGHISVWTSANTYADLDLSAGASGSWPVDALILYTSPSGKQLTLHYTGTVIVSPAQQVRTPATRTGDLKLDCQDQACVSQYNGGSAVVLSLSVSVLENGTEIGRFGIAANLGGLTSQATFKAAADA